MIHLIEVFYARLAVPTSPPATSPQETEADYESDFELDKVFF